MRVDLTSEIVIHRPRAAVAEYVLDPRNLAQWCSDVTTVRSASAGPTSVGSRFDVVSPGRLRDSHRTETVTELAPLERMTLRTTSGGPDLSTTITLAPEHRNSTLVTVRTHGDPGSLGAITAPLISRTTRRRTGTDLSRLKTILELDRP